MKLKKSIKAAEPKAVKIRTVKKRAAKKSFVKTPAMVEGNGNPNGEFVLSHKLRHLFFNPA